MNEQTNEKPRDYRDEIEVEQQLDLIRTAPRAEALELYRTCLDVPYHQGRAEATAEMVKRCARMLANLAGTLATDIAREGE